MDSTRTARSTVLSAVRFTRGVVFSAARSVLCFVRTATRSTHRGVCSDANSDASCDASYASKPSPAPSPAPSPMPSPTLSPTPTPFPTPSSTPSPTPAPAPIPEMVEIDILLRLEDQRAVMLANIHSKIEQDYQQASAIYNRAEDRLSTVLQRKRAQKAKINMLRRDIGESDEALGIKF